MKRNSLYKICIALAIGMMNLTSCLNAPQQDLPSVEISVPSGATNYLENNMDFDFEGGTKTMSFNSNLKWSMKVSDTQNGVQWLTIDPSVGSAGSNKVTFTADENNTYEDRSVVVKLMVGDTICNIRVNQKRMEAITLTSDIFEVPADGGYINVKLYYSTDYEITIPDDYKGWIHRTQNATRGLESSTIAFTIDPSDEYGKREGRIYFKARDEEEVVTVYQAGSGKLILSQNEFNLTGTEQEFSIDINSNFDFSMEMPEVDWLTENTSKTRGMSSHTLKFKVKENDDYNTRSAKIKFYDNNSKLSETVVVNQASIGAVITLNTLEYNVSCDKQDLDIEVNSNFDYDIDFQGATWVKQRKAKTRGITSRILRLSIDENENFETRTAKIKLYDKNSSASVEVILNQLSNAPTISAEKKEYEVDANKQNLDIKISSNVDYTVDLQGTEWISNRNAKTRTLATSTLNLSIDKNDSYDSRTAKIKLYEKNGSASEEITITQKAKNEIEIPNKEYIVDENGGTLNIEVNSNVDYKFIINDNCKEWIKEPSKTRGLTSHTHQLEISPLGDGKDRTGTITVSNEEFKISKTLTIKQRQTLVFNKAEVTILVDKVNKLSITNLTEQDIQWSSSDESIATVNKEGEVTGMKKGDATITAKSADGKHIATCKVMVREIVDLIDAYCNGGDVSADGNFVPKGGKLNWTFHNGSPAKVKLKSRQLIDGDGVKDKENAINKDVQAGSSETINITIQGEDIPLPVTCIFRFEYDNKEYQVSAKYEKK
jgi:uncharacterized protein YjdB